MPAWTRKIVEPVEHPVLSNEEYILSLVKDCTVDKYVIQLVETKSKVEKVLKRELPHTHRRKTFYFRNHVQ